MTRLAAIIMTNISNVKVNIVKKQAFNNMTDVVNCKYNRNQSPNRGHIPSS